MLCVILILVIPLKILTLKQPWATLVAEGLKQYEFRSWKTNYRGKLLIHAGAGIDKEDMKKFEHLGLKYPSKRILCEVEIIDCIKIDNAFNKMIKDQNNIVYGRKNRDGYAWVIGNVKKLDIDKEINGKLGLWNYDL